MENIFFMVFAKTLADLKIMRTFAPAIERESVGRETIKIIGALVQLVRIHACHAWGHGFESRTHRFLMKQNKRKVLKYYTLGLFFLPNTTPKSSGITQLALAYPLDFSGKKKVQRFSFVFADSQYFA